jgi:sulfhydrogenase subunit beta (sulfur reductase)
MSTKTAEQPPATIERKNLNALFASLQKRGYTVVGPKLEGGAIIHTTLSSSEELPAGWTDEQDGGTYRLKKRSDGALFGFTSGPQSWKQFLHPATIRLWQAKKSGNRFQITGEGGEASKLALFGVRSCDLHAITILDKVLMGGPFTDHGYQQRRSAMLIVALNCTHAGNTCFCVSMGTGPKVTEAFDILLTEVIEKSRHYFLAEAGSGIGREILQEVSKKDSTIDEISLAEQAVEDASSAMGRSVDMTDIRSLLYRNADNHRFHETAKRCLSCANCTMVCPTCFCTNVEDTTDLTGGSAERWRMWDSCFTMEFSYIHGGSVRSSVMARYRQWLTHKFASWIDQFGTPGCVGCGRCITWCPVGIDVTEEVQAIRQHDLKKTTTTA